MKAKSLSAGVIFGLWFSTAASLASAHAEKDRVVYSFTGGSDGSTPAAAFIADGKGNLYSTSYSGGTFGDGTVFRILPDGTETVLYSFAGGSDGAFPQSTLISDGRGNVYGTTTEGGAANLGTVFKLAPDGTETILWSFAGGNIDGASPMAGVIADSKGNLYGTTESGGSSATCSGSCGTVYRIDRNGSETLLHVFNGSPDGAYPIGSLFFDASGNLFGTTLGGGKQSNYCGIGCGTAFELSTTKNAWKETVIYSFRPDTTDGTNPGAGFIADGSGNLYSTTTIAGDTTGCLGGCGTVFELSPNGDGSWSQTTLYAFKGGKDGITPYSGLIADSAGNFYGTTFEGGSGNCSFGTGCGVVFELSPNGREKVLHAFAGTPDDGANSQSGLYLDGKGTVYGTTDMGGSTEGCFENQGCGAVFRLRK